MHDASDPSHEDHEYGDFGEKPETLDDIDAPDCGAIPKGDAELTLTLERCGQLASTANALSHSAMNAI